jgi:hypothetical protein
MGTGDIPQVLILGTQRSGTHVLESFFRKHPQIHIRGEVFLPYEKTGKAGGNISGKLNIGILMYSQVAAMEKMGGKLLDQKIIHLLRNPKAIARSRLQMEADRKVLGAQYRAHLYQGESLPRRGIPDTSVLEKMARSIEMEQEKYKEILKGTFHLELHYEDFVPSEESISVLDRSVQIRVLSFLGLKDPGVPFYTKHVKTGIRSSEI